VTPVRELEVPPGWMPPRPVRTFGLAAVGLAFSVLILLMGAAGLTDTDTDMRLFSASLALIGIGFAIGGVTIARRGLRRRSVVRGIELAKTEDGTAVLRIRQPRVVQMIGGLAFVCVGGGAVLFGAAQLAAGGIAGVLMLGCGAYLAGVPLVTLLRGAPLAEIRLDPQAVQLRGSGRRLTALWGDLEAVVGVETRHQRLLVILAGNVERRPERFSWATPRQRRRDAERIDIVTDHFAAEPVLLFHLLCFYHEHPSARAELGTAASLQRVHEERFAAP
jgi:hypothetical protein